MFGIVSVLRRREGIDREQFRDWWLNTHVPHVKHLPGLLRYEVYPASTAFDPKSQQWAAEPTCDGAAILWFESEKAAREALASPAGVPQRFNQMGEQVIALAGEPVVVIDER